MPAHYLAFWNVENLFAPEGHPERIPWIREAVGRDLQGWTAELYGRKLAQLARVVAAMNDGRGPDLLGVCEVEDRSVLVDLARAVAGLAPGRAYEVVHADNARDQRGIDTAFLYDPALYAVDPGLIFNHWVMRRTGTRDILQATFRTRSGRDLVALMNHWPSRSGGAAESAGFRAVAGETLAYWHERIREEVGERACVVAGGDFNDDPWDPSLRHNARAWRERGDVERTEGARFWNLAWGYLQAHATDRRGRARVLDGTLYFGGDGNVFDQILVSRPLLDDQGAAFKLRDGTAGVFALPAMVDHRAGEGPVRFGLSKGDAAANVNPDGFSDHFPVVVTLDEAG